MAANEGRKDVLRRTVRARRAAMNPATRRIHAEQIGRLTLELPELQHAQCVFAYVSTEPEVHTHKLIEELLRAGKAVAVPVIRERGHMEAASIASLDELMPGLFGIPTPKHPRPLETPIDAVLAPCVAVTLQGRRLGSGGGYYDRFLAEHPDVFVAALAFESQFVEQVPFQPHDRAVQAVVTETRIVRCHPDFVTPSP